MRENDYRNVALLGKSGAGKTTVANYLVEKYGYFRVSTGDVCRDVCQKLFGTESRGMMNRVTDALKEIDQNVWLNAALRSAVENKPIVFDSIRFPSDHRELMTKGYDVWRIQASYEIRICRMRLRGQNFDPVRDEEHESEVSLDGIPVSVLIQNDGTDLDEFYRLIEKAVTSESSHR